VSADALFSHIRVPRNRSVNGLRRPHSDHGASRGTSAAFSPSSPGRPSPLASDYHRRAVARRCRRAADGCVIQAGLGDPGSWLPRDGVHVRRALRGFLCAPRPNAFLAAPTRDTSRNLFDSRPSARVGASVLISFPHVRGARPRSRHRPLTPRPAAYSVHARHPGGDGLLMEFARLETHHHAGRFRLGIVYVAESKILSCRGCANGCARRRLSQFLSEPTLFSVSSLPAVISALTESRDSSSLASRASTRRRPEPVTLHQFSRRGPAGYLLVYPRPFPVPLWSV